MNQRRDTQRKDTRHNDPLLACEYFQAGQCRSCTEIRVPQNLQLAAKWERAKECIPAQEWLAPLPSRRDAFRNKVKLAVGGRRGEIRLGVMNPDATVSDLRYCPLPTPGIQYATRQLVRFLNEIDIAPYHIRTRQGLMKFVIVTESPDGELMIRFVARRRGVQGLLFKRLERLRELIPAAKVVSLNVQSEPAAIIEGPEEILISAQAELPMRLCAADKEMTLYVRPQSFFQTNTDAAQALYTRAVEWLAPRVHKAWDLYCGVGGFGLALALHGIQVTGIEVQEQAVAAAQRAADEYAEGRAQFLVGDAQTWPLSPDVDAIIVNPPRRGIGTDLARWINDSEVEQVLYSSCNVESCARDIAQLSNYRVERAQVVEMFAHTAHFETICLLSRIA
ncbi:methyltransferase domain-containing protein [Trueperella sp. LYQ141]|uniref:methyltransferase domain-containing protein n=1 Tax=Trueperella sp. LYQ141 TaxID=3391058 RepID=UPI0039834C17